MNMSSIIPRRLFDRKFMHVRLAERCPLQDMTRWTRPSAVPIQIIKQNLINIMPCACPWSYGSVRIHKHIARNCNVKNDELENDRIQSIRVRVRIDAHHFHTIRTNTTMLNIHSSLCPCASWAEMRLLDESGNYLWISMPMSIRKHNQDDFKWKANGHVVCICICR